MPTSQKIAGIPTKRKQMDSSKDVIDFEESRRLRESKRLQQGMNSHMKTMQKDRVRGGKLGLFKSEPSILKSLSDADQKEKHRLEMEMAVLEACWHKLVLSTTLRLRKRSNRLLSHCPKHFSETLKPSMYECT
jgi:hypothetical protein